MLPVLPGSIFIALAFLPLFHFVRCEKGRQVERYQQQYDTGGYQQDDHSRRVKGFSFYLFTRAWFYDTVAGNASPGAVRIVLPGINAQLPGAASIKRSSALSSKGCSPARNGASCRLP